MSENGASSQRANPPMATRARELSMNARSSGEPLESARAQDMADSFLQRLRSWLSPPPVHPWTRRIPRGFECRASSIALAEGSVAIRWRLRPFHRSEFGYIPGYPRRKSSRRRRRRFGRFGQSYRRFSVQTNLMRLSRVRSSVINRPGTRRRDRSHGDPSGGQTPFTSETVIPWTPTSESAFLTSSSL